MASVTETEPSTESTEPTEPEHEPTDHESVQVNSWGSKRYSLRQNPKLPQRLC